MKQKSLLINLFYILLFIALSAATTSAQTSFNTFKDFGYKGGIQFNEVMATTEFEDDNGLALSSFLFRGFFRFELNNNFQAEINAGFGRLSGDGGSYYKPSSRYTTTIIPVEARLLYTPFDIDGWNPYFFAGFGLLNYNVTTKPVSVSPSPVNGSGTTGVIPFGIGTEIRVSDEVAVDLSLGYSYSLSDDINNYKIPNTTNDGYIHFGIGISFSKESLNSDKDKDGLTLRDELALGTDPNNPDTDADGINDGDEVHKYHTNPLKADTDGDGLSDYDEIFKYHTDPLKADTDGDGLTDGDEILKFKTDPLKADTDGDGLNDGDEIMKYKTDPLKADTDGDGLTDGEEVLKYHTDPLKADTDGGTVPDGVEVKRGTNPLDPSDDIPITEVEVTKTFDNVYFGFNHSNLTKLSKKDLDSVYAVLTAHADAKISLAGHTDWIGSDKYNQKLSEKRADVVTKSLVKKGINEAQIKAEGFGKRNPVESNKTAKGRAKNRRTEISAKWMEKVKK
jgi:outer membrane protein OmpA-like peptidoglycan-associated protein/opacity protein-like surface antigen